MHVSNTNIENCKENDRQALLKEILDADILGLSTEELLEYINMNKQQKKEQELLKQHIENFYHICRTLNISADSCIFPYVNTENPVYQELIRIIAKCDENQLRVLISTASALICIDRYFIIS